jgi:hypothetical protein
MHCFPFEKKKNSKRMQCVDEQQENLHLIAQYEYDTSEYDKNDDFNPGHLAEPKHLTPLLSYTCLHQLQKVGAAVVVIVW